MSANGQNGGFDKDKIHQPDLRRNGRRNSTETKCSELDHSDHFESSTEKTLSMTDQQDDTHQTQSPDPARSMPKQRHSRKRSGRDRDDHESSLQRASSRSKLTPPVELAPLPPLNGSGVDHLSSYLDHVTRQKYELESQVTQLKEKCTGLEREVDSLHAQMKLFFAMAAESAPHLLDLLKSQLSVKNVLIPGATPLGIPGPRMGALGSLPGLGKLKGLHPPPLPAHLASQMPPGMPKFVGAPIVTSMPGLHPGPRGKGIGPPASHAQMAFSLAQGSARPRAAGILPTLRASNPLQPMLAPLPVGPPLLRSNSKGQESKAPTGTGYRVMSGNLVKRGNHTMVSGPPRSTEPYSKPLPQRASFPTAVPSQAPSRPPASRSPVSGSLPSAGSMPALASGSPPPPKLDASPEKRQVSAPVPYRPKPVYHASLPGKGDSSAFRVVKANQPYTSDVQHSSPSNSEPQAPLQPRHSGPISSGAMPNGAAAIFEMAKNQAALGKRW